MAEITAAPAPNTLTEKTTTETTPTVPATAGSTLVQNTHAENTNAGNTTTGQTTEENTTADNVASEQPLLQHLHNAERHWIWKAGVRSILCVLNAVAIGCCAWLISRTTTIESNPFRYYFDFNDSAPGAVVVCSVSFIWCLIWIAIPLFLRPPRPLHPAIAVSFDLVLWMAYLVIALFSLAGIFGLLSFASDGEIEDPASSQGAYNGLYQLAPNGTWVYEITSINDNNDNYYYNYTSGRYEYDPVDPYSMVRNCASAFASCVEQDEYINGLWRDKSKRFALEVVINAVEWLGMLFHFALFVWACVDCHRYNRAKSTGRDKIVADRIIADLERRGLIAVQNGMVVQPPPAAYMPQMTQRSNAPPQGMFQPPPQGTQPAKGDINGVSPRWA